MLNLSREGIFPLVGENGVAPTGWPYPGTIQGEGKLCGVPSVFIRLQGCNLSCVWTTPDGRKHPCDTPHSQSKAQMAQISPEKAAQTLMDIYERTGISHVVVTGGEPFLQAAEVAKLLYKLHEEEIHVTVETNGTIYHEWLAEETDLLSVSPKPNCDTKTLARLIDAADDYQLKFVVGSESDESYILRVLGAVGLEAEDRPNHVFVMPLGANTETIGQTAPIAAKIAVRNNWRYSPRLHIGIWGNREGV